MLHPQNLRNVQEFKAIFVKINEGQAQSVRGLFIPAAHTVIGNNSLQTRE